MLPPGRRQRLRTTRLTRRIQRFDSRTISLFVRMVIALGHRHRLAAGEVVDLLYGDAKVKHSCDEGVAEVMGPDMAEAGSMACRGKAFANRRIGDDPVPSGTAVFTYLAPAVVVGIGA